MQNFKLDVTSLSPGRQEYMEQAVDLKKYADGFLKHSHDCLFYVKKKEWTETLVDDRGTSLQEDIMDFTIEQLSLNK